MSEIHDTVAVCIQTGLSIVSNSNMACIALPRLYVSAKGSYGGSHEHSILPLGAQYFSRGRKILGAKWVDIIIRPMISTHLQL